MRRVAERPHAALQGLVVEALRELRAAPVDAIEVVVSFGQLTIQRNECIADARERGARVGVQPVGVTLLKLSQRREHVALRAARAQETFRERAHAARFHERFAREAEQPVERPGAHAQHALGIG